MSLDLEVVFRVACIHPYHVVEISYEPMPAPRLEASWVDAHEEVVMDDDVLYRDMPPLAPGGPAPVVNHPMTQRQTVLVTVLDKIHGLYINTVDDVADVVPYYLYCGLAVPQDLQVHLAETPLRDLADARRDARAAYHSNGTVPISQYKKLAERCIRYGQLVDKFVEVSHEATLVASQDARVAIERLGALGIRSNFGYLPGEDT